MIASVELLRICRSYRSVHAEDFDGMDEVGILEVLDGVTHHGCRDPVSFAGHPTLEFIQRSESSHLVQGHLHQAPELGHIGEVEALDDVTEYHGVGEILEELDPGCLTAHQEALRNAPDGQVFIKPLSDVLDIVTAHVEQGRDASDHPLRCNILREGEGVELPRKAPAAKLGGNLFDQEFGRGAGDVDLAGEGVHEAIDKELPVVEILDLIEEEIHRFLCLLGKERIICISNNGRVMASEAIEAVIGEVEDAEVLFRYSAFLEFLAIEVLVHALAHPTHSGDDGGLPLDAFNG